MSKHNESVFVEDLPVYSEGAVVGAYVLAHKSTGCFYVGSSVNLRERINLHQSHLRRGIHANKKLAELVAHDDEVSVGVVRTHTREEAYAIEQAVLDQHHGDPYCLNIAKDAKSSPKGRPLSPETRHKQSQSLQGREFSEESRLKMSQASLGVPKSQEHVAKMRQARKEINSCPVIVEGTRFDSIAEACRQFNTLHQTVHRRIRSTDEKFKNWNYAERVDLPKN
jgi:group I intron endonuclease